jgi:hypothetical protein
MFRQFNDGIRVAVLWVGPRATFGPMKERTIMANQGNRGGTRTPTKNEQGNRSSDQGNKSNQGGQTNQGGQGNQSNQNNQGNRSQGGSNQSGGGSQGGSNKQSERREPDSSEDDRNRRTEQGDGTR